MWLIIPGGSDSLVSTISVKNVEEAALRAPTSDTRETSFYHGSPDRLNIVSRTHISTVYKDSLRKIWESLGIWPMSGRSGWTVRRSMPLIVVAIVHD